MSDVVTSPVKTAKDILSELTKLRADTNRETAGVVVRYGKIHVRLARMGGTNKRFINMFEAESAPYRAMMANKIQVPEEITKSILFKCYAECIVMEWGMDTDDGYSEITYTPSDCIDMFKADPDFFQFVVNVSQDMSNYRAGAVDADAKN